MTAGRGHDIFEFIGPVPSLEDHAIDHGDIVAEVEAKVGPMTPLVERSVRNGKTGRYYAFSDWWSPNPVQYRRDLWTDDEPSDWDAILATGRRLKAAGHPLSMGFSPDQDATMGLLSFLFAFGASIQDREGNVVINSPEAVDAVRAATALFREGMTEEMLSWDALADNRFLAAGKASFILDPISAIRATEKQDPGLAESIALAPVPAGPAGRIGLHALVGSFVVMRSSSQQETAKQFLADIALGYREQVLRSELYNLPAFPGAVPDLAALLADDPAPPAGKYGVLAEAATWTTNLGHPGNDNPAIEEVFYRWIIPEMFASVARGEATPEQAVAAADAEIAPIFAKWRERGRI